MFVDHDWFPYRPLNAGEVAEVTNLCGGELPIPEPEYLEGFLNYSAKPFLRDHILLIVLPKLSSNYVDALDVKPGLGRPVVENAALFYVGVLNEVSPLGTLPCDDEVLAEILHSDVNDFSLTAAERLTSEARSFQGLLDGARIALRAEDYRLEHLARVGAGLVHALVFDSLKKQDNISTYLNEHPELADLGANLTVEDEISD